MEIECFHLGTKVSIKLDEKSKNKFILTQWSEISAFLNRLKHYESYIKDKLQTGACNRTNEQIEQKIKLKQLEVWYVNKNVWLSSCELLLAKKITEKHFPPDVVACAFDCYAISRAAYKSIYNYLPIPGVKTLQRLTSSISKLDDEIYFSKIFKDVSKENRIVVLLHDEIYVREQYLYHGGTVFGEALNKEEVKAKIKLREQKAEQLLAKTDSVAVKASTKTNQVRKKPDKETLAGTCHFTWRCISAKMKLSQSLILAIFKMIALDFFKQITAFKKNC